MASSMPSRDLRARTRTIDYKEPSESDIKVPGDTRRSSKHKELFPIEVVEEDTTRYKVHYLGYSSSHDEWKNKADIVDIEHGECLPNCQHRFSLYHKLSTRIKNDS